MTFQTTAKGLAALAATLVLGLSTLPSAGATTLTYTVTDIGTIAGGQSVALGISPNNVVTGYAQSNTALVGFVSSNGKNTILSPLSGQTSSSGNSVNSAGLVAGVSGSDACIFTNGVPKDLGNLGGGTSSASGINTSGTVVGTSEDSGAFQRAFVCPANGKMSEIGTLGGIFSYANAIADDGDIVGSSYINTYEQHAFYYHAGVMSDIGTLGGENSYATCVNKYQRVAGYSYLSDNVTTHGFTWRPGHPIHDLPPIGGSGSSTAAALNRFAYIVGNSNGHGVIWIDCAVYDLNPLVTTPGWTIIQATGINDNGYIAATGRDSAGQLHAVILNPSTPPNSSVVILPKVKTRSRVDN